MINHTLSLFLLHFCNRIFSNFCFPPLPYVSPIPESKREGKGVGRMRRSRKRMSGIYAANTSTHSPVSSSVRGPLGRKSQYFPTKFVDKTEIKNSKSQNWPKMQEKVAFFQMLKIFKNL